LRSIPPAFRIVVDKEVDRLFGVIAVELGYIDDAAVDAFLSRN
jgi:hypothetical protein